jgi:phosphate transport system protein
LRETTAMNNARRKSVSTEDVTTLARKACLVAKDAAFNVRDYLENASNLALVAVKQCEKELDEIERTIDDSLPAAMTEVSEKEARQLLACLKFVIDLERIGDLLWSGANGIRHISGRLPEEDTKSLIHMADTLKGMLEEACQGFIDRDIELANSVLRTDGEIDQACHVVFQRYMRKPVGKRSADATQVLFIAQALERAGDHAKNLAEEIIHLARGHSFRHSSKARLRSE